MTVQRIQVDSESILQEVGQLSAAELDQLPFGVIQLDPQGTVLSYNKAEERLAGRQRADVVGRNFFRDIAPCTRVQRFLGAFQTGVERRELNEVFDFVFEFASGAREVRIRMIYSAETVWVFVTPLA